MGLNYVKVEFGRISSTIKFNQLHQPTRDHMFFREPHLVRFKTGVTIWFNTVLSPLLF